VAFRMFAVMGIILLLVAQPEIDDVEPINRT